MTDLDSALELLRQATSEAAQARRLEMELEASDALTQDLDYDNRNLRSSQSSLQANLKAVHTDAQSLADAVISPLQVLARVTGPHASWERWLSHVELNEVARAIHVLPRYTIKGDDLYAQRKQIWQRRLIVPDDLRDQGLPVSRTGARVLPGEGSRRPGGR